jgi:hypothetical protein
VSDQFGRSMLLKMWPQILGDDPALPELQLVQAKARQESNYGLASYRGPEGSAVLLNWGAVQASHGPPCGADSFLVTDTHTDGTPFNFCYKRYASHEEGCADFLRILLIKRPSVLAAARSGSVQDFAQAVFDTRYSELRVEKQVESYWKNVNAIARSLGEPVAVHLESGGGGDGGDGLGPFSSDPPSGSGGCSSAAEKVR